MVSIGRGIIATQVICVFRIHGALDPMSTTDPLSIRQLEVFVTLTEKKSFTKAARHLGLSQSTVSGHMADLERRLGIRLAERDRAGVEPTAAGRILLVPARETLRAERHARMAAAQLKGLLEGELVVGGSTIPAVYVLPPLLAAFRKVHDGVDIRVVTGDSEGVTAAVAAGDVDIALVGGRPEKPVKGVEFREGGADELVLIAPPKHPLTAMPNAGVANLQDVGFVTREEGSGTQAAVVATLHESLSDLKLRTVCQVGSTEGVKAAVRAGVGVAFVSKLAAQDDANAGFIEIVPLEGLSVRRQFVWVARPDDRLSPAARVFGAQVLG